MEINPPERRTSWWQGELLPDVLFWLFLFIILVNRVCIFLTININFIDSDQPFMWIGCSDYAKGLFYEPRFYGQDYNTFLEPLVALPFVWLRVPVYYAVPIATHLLFLFPVIFTASVLYMNRRKENALAVLAIVLCLTPAFDILTSIPRGFVTGIFFTGFYILSLLHPHSPRYFLLNGILSVAGYFVNPNSLIASAPFMFYIFILNYTDRKFYVAALCIISSAIPFYFLFDHFYRMHPGYVVYGLQYGLSPSYFFSNIAHLDSAFQHISFFKEGTCIPVLALMVFTGWLCWRGNRPLFYAFMVFLFVILLSFFSGKVRDGCEWPYYSFSRMYLAIPTAFCLFLGVLHLERKWFVVIVTPLVLVFTTYKFVTFSKNIRFHGLETPWLGVHLVDLALVKRTVDLYKDFAEKAGVDRIIVSNGFWLNTVIAYGGPAIYPNYPATEETNSERRYQVREGNKNKVFSKFLVLSVKTNLDSLLANNNNFRIERLDDFGLFVVRENSMKNGEFISLVKKIEHE